MDQPTAAVVAVVLLAICLTFGALLLLRFSGRRQRMDIEGEPTDQSVLKSDYRQSFHQEDLPDNRAGRLTVGQKKRVTPTGAPFLGVGGLLVAGAMVAGIVGWQGLAGLLMFGGFGLGAAGAMVRHLGKTTGEVLSMAGLFAKGHDRRGDDQDRYGFVLGPTALEFKSEVDWRLLPQGWYRIYFLADRKVIVNVDSLSDGERRATWKGVAETIRTTVEFEMGTFAADPLWRDLQYDQAGAREQAERIVGLSLTRNSSAAGLARRMKELIALAESFVDPETENTG